MSEFLNQLLENIRLTSLKVGDTVDIKLGTGNQVFSYSFIVEEEGNWPTGIMTETYPNGSLGGSGLFSLHGSGMWTTREQNPVQDQQVAFTSYFDQLQVGRFLVGALPNAEIGDRLVFDNPGQEISGLSLTK